MRLGIVGMCPGDMRQLEARHLKEIAALGLTGASLGGSTEILPEITSADCTAVRAVFESTGVDLVQFSIRYPECLFDPDDSVRERVVETIHRGIEVGGELDADVTLIRPGSLSPTGSYSPSPDNHRPECKQRLVETLRIIADKAEATGVTVVVETHLLTLMDSPEANVEFLSVVGSDHLKVVMDYVNHLQTVRQVFESKARIDHIFDIMGPISAVGHYKDAVVSDGLVVHIDEAIPGEGELDLSTVLRRWDGMHPDGYMLIEHLRDEQYPLAAANAHRQIAEAGVELR